MKPHRRQLSDPENSKHHCHRRGSWLPQLVITLTIMSVLMTISSSALFRMYRQETLMVERIFQTSTWLRLSRDFRRDIHVASSVTPSEDGLQLTLKNSETDIVWLIAGDEVKRVLHQSDTAEPASLPGEEYAFADSTLRFSVTTAESTGSVASLQMTPPATPNGSTPQTRSIPAAVGLDHRFNNPGNESEDE